MKQLTGLMAAAALLGCSAAHAYPKRPAVPVLDLANIFPTPDEAALDQRLTKYWAESGNAVVVVSVNSLDGQSVEKYAFGLFNQWGIGDAKTDRGLLVLVAPNEHKVRIEVGCGLLGIVTDDKAAQIIRENIIPQYRQRHLEAGTLAGVDALITTLRHPQPMAANNPHAANCRALAKRAA